MSILLYKLGIWLYYLGIRITSIFNTKAKRWVDGRKNVFKELAATRKDSAKYIWIHCASLGEFEQARPLIEELKIQYPSHQIALTFFSPSGFLVRKDYKHAAIVCYLPLDTKKNADTFVQILKPQLAIFVKYEFWYFHLKALNDQAIPIILVSAIFLEKHVFFKPYGGFFRKMLGLFEQLFVQDQASIALLDSIGIQKTKLAKDTRFDRVASLTTEAFDDPFLDKFCQGFKIIIAGSTWPKDDALLEAVIEELGTDEYKFVIAPHDIDHAKIDKLIHKLQAPSLKYSDAQVANHSRADSKILIVDSIGILSKLYRYGHIVYIGGGFDKSIHNILEAAVYGFPVLFGPAHHKMREALDLKEIGGAFEVTNSTDFVKQIKKLQNEAIYKQASLINSTYVKENIGGTETIMHAIQSQKWLDSE